MCRVKTLDRGTVRLCLGMLRRLYSDAATQIEESGTFAINSEVVSSALRSLSRRHVISAASETYLSVRAQKADVDPALKEEWERQIEDRILAFLSVKVGWIEDTTRRDVFDVMRYGLDQGMNSEQIARELRNRIPSMSRRRAKTIARTEQTGLQSAGAFFGAMSAGATEKEWHTFEDELVRDPLHRDLQGVRIPMQDPFESGGHRGLFPGDISLGAGPEWLINCRCLVIYYA